MPGRLSLRTRIAFAVTASIVPAALLAAMIVSYDSYQRERSRIVHDTTGIARALVASVDGRLQEAQAVLYALSTSPALQGGDFAAFRAQATAASQQQGFSNVVLIDATDEQQKMNTLVPPGAPLRRATHPVLIGIARDGKPALTEFFHAPVVKQWVVGVGIPVRGKNGARYSLNAGVTGERLQEVLARQHLPSGWVAAVFDATGTIAARTHDPERFVGAKGAPALVERMKEAAPEGSLETDTVEGTAVLSVYSRSPRTGWAVAIGIPRAELIQQLLVSMARLAIIAFVLIGTALVLAIVIGNRLAEGERS